MTTNPRDLKCKTIVQANMLMYKLVIVDRMKSYSIGSYETARNAMAARVLAEEIIRTAKSEEELQKGFDGLYAACDIHTKKDYRHLPRMQVPQFTYQKDTGCYYAKLKGTGYSLGSYAPHEIDVGKNRLAYTYQLVQDGRSHMEIDRITDVFCKIQRQERISLESFTKRITCANSLVLGICSSDENGIELSNVSPIIDTILQKDFNFLTEQDFGQYNYIVLYNFDERPYPDPEEMPELTRPYLTGKKILSVSNKPRKENMIDGA